MQNVIVNVNGQIRSFSAEKAHEDRRVSVFDRSYLYGDSLYEVARSYQGRLFAVEDHLNRLEQSARLCRMELKQSLSHYAKEMHRTVDAFYEKGEPGQRKIEVYCRIIVSRGEGRIGFNLKQLQTSTQYSIIVQPLDEPTEAQLAQGYQMMIPKRHRLDPRALDPAMKSGNYLNSLLAYLEAAEAGFDDALLVNSEGFLTEGTTFNLFYVRRGIVATPPLDIGILDGITRRKTLEVARELGIDAREIRFPRERLYEADEVFMTSTIKEVFPVTKVDSKKIGNGKPGPMTLKLRAALQEKIRKEMA